MSNEAKEDKSQICPHLSDSGTFIECREGDCAWWVSNLDTSEGGAANQGCALRVVAQRLCGIEATLDAVSDDASPVIEVMSLKAMNGDL